MISVDLATEHFSFYMLIIPSTLAIELSRIMIRQAGAKYFRNTLYSFFLRKGEDCSISFVILSIPTTFNTRIQVASAARGIITEFVVKSKKSRKFIPKIRMKSRSPCTGQCRKQYQYKEYNSCHSTQTHTCKYLGQGNKHQGRSCLKSLRVPA